MREVLVSDETMENNNDNNTGGIEAIDANETVQENNPPDNVSTTNESESSVRIVWEKNTFYSERHKVRQNFVKSNISAKFEACNLT